MARALDAILRPDTLMVLAIIIVLGCPHAHKCLQDAQVHDDGHDDVLRAGWRCGAGPCKNRICVILMDLRRCVGASGGTLTPRQSHWPSYALSFKYVCTHRALASLCLRANLVSDSDTGTLLGVFSCAYDKRKERIGHV